MTTIKAFIYFAAAMAMAGCGNEHPAGDSWDTATNDSDWVSFNYLPERKMSVEAIKRLYGQPDFVGKIGHDDIYTPQGDTLKGLWQTLYGKYHFDGIRRYDWNLSDGHRLVMFFLTTNSGLKPVAGYKFNPEVHKISMDDYDSGTYCIPYSRYWNSDSDVPWDLMSKNPYWVSLQYLDERNLPVDSIDARYGQHRAETFTEEKAPIYFSDQRFDGIHSLTYARHADDDIEICTWRVDSNHWLELYYVHKDYSRPVAGYLYDPSRLPE